MMQSATTVKVHHRQSPPGGNHGDDRSSNHHHNHPHSGSHSRRRRHHQPHHTTNNKTRQQPFTTISFGGTRVRCDSGSGGGGGGYFCSRYRHIIYVVIGIFFFVSIQLRLLIWGYHASKIPVQGSQHEPLSQYTQNQQQQQQQQQNHDRQQQLQRRQRRESPDGYMNGFPIYYQDLTFDPTFHTRPYSQIHCVGENYQHHHKHHHEHPTGGDVESEEGSNNANGDNGDIGNNDDNQSLGGVETAWMKKSCHYRFICLNLTSHEFQMYNRPTLDTPLEKWSQQKKYADQNTLDVSSSVMMTTESTTTTSQSTGTQNGLKLNGVSLGAIDDDGNGLRWTPTVISDRPPPEKFYTLEDGVVFVPFFSIQGWDLKSLLWDDFFALYNLLHIFQFDDDSDHASTTTTTTTEQQQQQQQRQYQPLLMRYVPSSDYGSMTIPATSCDTSQAWYEQCQSMLHKYQSFMMMTTTIRDDKTVDIRSGSSTAVSGIQKLITTQRDVVLHISKTDKIKTKPDEQNLSLQTDLVCAKDGVAGIGPLTDHGTNGILPGRHSHHYRYANGVRSHNYGRGAVLWKFRRFCLHNLGLTTDRIDHFGHQSAKSHKIIVAKSTAQRLKWLLRPPTFNTMLKKDENGLVPKLDIEQYDFLTMDVKDSVEAVMGASFFVVDCIDRSNLIMSIFLPKRSNLIIYCDDENDSDNSKSNTNIYDNKTKKPKDRDLLNNLSYVSVHWITTTSSDSDDKEIFEQLIWHELYRHDTASTK